MVSLQIAEESMNRRGKIAESLITLERPDLINLFTTYQNEAIAARIFLQSSLIELDSGAEILEVGGGILALAVQLASEGFKVTTVEPVGEGFTGISYIMNIFLEIARKEDEVFTLIKSPIEECRFDHKFDFIFSINVMEHLKNPYTALIGIVNNLKFGCYYRFLCPNYDFPYEPHFGKWLISRSNNAFFLSRKRAKSNLIAEHEIQGLYSSLNFLTLKKITQSLKFTQISLSANRNSLYEIMSRSIYDVELKKRHIGLTNLVRLLFALKLHYLAKLVPVNHQPIMDVKTTLLSN
jgi:2-polyprenyl-3-methyl-5-hydroxy-6-metoxy-1,4-benzoquinol methylase